MTNIDKIIALLSKNPGLDDDEISSHANIRPRQQVNQICRRLESRGVLKRTTGPRGKVVNYLLKPPPDLQIRTKPITAVGNIYEQPKLPITQSFTRNILRRQRSGAADLAALNCLDLEKTLILIPCSGKKSAAFSNSSNGPTIIESLPPQMGRDLDLARSDLAIRANLDESALTPAWKRYTGTLYRSAEPALESAIKDGLHIVIISGGYGLLLAEEPIGTYNLAFKTSNWPKELLENVLLSYMKKCKLGNVVAFVSASTGYRQFLERVSWTAIPDLNVFFVLPEATTGAMLKAPRAQGEGLHAFLCGSLKANWTSSDNLGLIIEQKV